MGQNLGGRVVLRLNAIAVSRTKNPGLHADGDGLYLQVSANGTRSWIFRYRHAGRRRDMGLGSARVISLAAARQKAMQARRLLVDGRDPIEARQEERAARAATSARLMNFEAAARACIADRADGWRNEKHAAQWIATLEAYVFPLIGQVPVSAIDTPLVLKVLKPIWKTKTETASRVRGRIETVLDWAKAHRLREGDNPARWRGVLDQVLPRRSKVQSTVHHPALAFAEIGAFVVALRGQSGMAARALEFLILTATRTSETLHATWDEIDLKAAIWTIPGKRMKSGRPHRVPLTDAALGILNSMGSPRTGGFIFAGGKAGRALSNNALLALLERMERSDITAHGFRSTFRDWAATQTNFPGELAERALAHVQRDKVEAAYQRDDLLERRRLLMAAWAKYCETLPAHSAAQSKAAAD